MGMQKRGIFLLLACFYGYAGFAGAEELYTDEQGPTAVDAVDVAVVGDNFLTPSYVIPEAPDETQSVDVVSEEIEENNELNNAESTGIPPEIDILSEIFGSSDLASLTAPVLPKTPAAAKTFTPAAGVQPVENQPLLTELPPPLRFDTPAEIIEPKKSAVLKTTYADNALAMAESGLLTKNMPREIRITFYPGMASFSAQALKWAKSFALHVVHDPRLMVEIRISQTNWGVQEKRLKVLLQILKEIGVSVHQIRIYKTNRDANSILMGYAKNPEKATSATRIVGEKKQKTIEW